MWNKDAPYKPESAKAVRWELVPYTRGRVLDVGCGSYKPFPHFFGVDSGIDAQLFGIQPTAANMLIEDAAKIDMFADGSWDSVFSSHCLEHLKDYKAALREWWRLLKVGGYLVLYLPHADHYPNIGQEGANPDHKHDFRPGDILEALREFAHGEVKECQERTEEDEYSFLLVVRKAASGGLVDPLPRDKSNDALVIRYGAYGDIIQSLEVCRALKQEGKYVILNTTPRGAEVAVDCPWVDELMLQDTDQVPNPELGDYIAHLFKKYNGAVYNLCESVEGSLLALPGRPQYGWNKAARHTYMNHNYTEFMFDMCGLKYVREEFAQQFYPTQRELEATRKYKGDKPLVVMAVGGSSFHKTWPHMDAFIARVLVSDPNVRVALLGGEKERILEQGWEKEPRVLKLCGRLHIRESLTLACVSDLVIGPETGILNAVAALPMPKLVLLSHSSHENLTRDWRNVCPLFAERVPCYPCHMMHFDNRRCLVHQESSTAACAFEVSVDDAWAAYRRAMWPEAEVAAIEAAEAPSKVPFKPLPLRQMIEGVLK